jgi:hypothetical protein
LALKWYQSALEVAGGEDDQDEVKEARAYLDDPRARHLTPVLLSRFGESENVDLVPIVCHIRNWSLRSEICQAYRLQTN